MSFERIKKFPTGLFDMNNKEICEGDILRVSEERKFGRVIFNYFELSFHLFYGTYLERLVGNHVRIDVEVLCDNCMRILNRDIRHFKHTEPLWYRAHHDFVRYSISQEAPVIIGSIYDDPQLEDLPFKDGEILNPEFNSKEYLRSLLYPSDWDGRFILKENEQKV